MGALDRDNMYVRSSSVTLYCFLDNFTDVSNERLICMEKCKLWSVNNAHLCHRHTHHCLPHATVCTVRHTLHCMYFLHVSPLFPSYSGISKSAGVSTYADASGAVGRRVSDWRFRKLAKLADLGSLIPCPHLLDLVIATVCFTVCCLLIWEFMKQYYGVALT